jgi:hypothetical protein
VNLKNKNATKKIEDREAMENPFRYEAASNLKIGEVLDWYVEDHLDTQQIRSQKNLFIFGERGSGKSMILRRYSIEGAVEKSRRNKTQLDLEFVGIYVKCNSPLLYKREYELIQRNEESNARAALLSEYILATWCAIGLIEQLKFIPNIFSNASEGKRFSENISFHFDISLPKNRDYLDWISKHLNKNLYIAQSFLSDKDLNSIPFMLRGFNSIILPILNELKQLSRLKDSHFIFLLDDAHDFYSLQRESVNSWIAYRDHSLYSLKLAISNRDLYDFSTSNGSVLAEVHDYSTLDLQNPYQNSGTDFFKFIEEVFRIRLEKMNILVNPQDFFPSSKTMTEKIEKIRIELRNQYVLTHPDAKKKQIDDYLYKNTRATYFRTQSPQANHHSYAGFSTVVEVSSGVTRNALEVAWRAFDACFLRGKKVKIIGYIDEKHQNTAIGNCSDTLWKNLHRGLDKESVHVSFDDGQKIKHLLERLGEYFKKRSLDPKESEPRVLSFVLSEIESGNSQHQEVRKILNLAIRHGLIFTRFYSSRDVGKFDILYTPNKFLWPRFGLDVVGQFGRASLPVHRVFAAMQNKEIPYKPEEVDQNRLL